MTKKPVSRKRDDPLRKFRTRETPLAGPPEAAADGGARLRDDIALARYLSAALDRLDYLEHGDPRDFLLLAHKQEVAPTPLSRVWVPALFRSDASPNSDDTVETILAESQPGRLILSGPGGGKSTVGRFIVCATTRALLAGEGRRFGVFVPLAKYRVAATYRKAIAECAAEHVGLGDDEEVKEAIEANLDQAIVVFDGFDECPVSKPAGGDADVALKSEALTHISALRVDPERRVASPRAMTQFVVTCRADDYAKDPCLPRLAAYRLTEFSPGQMNEAVVKWHEAAKQLARDHSIGGARIGEELDARRDSILSALRENPELCSLCQTPLMLATLQIVYQGGGDLPGSVSQLCDQAIDWLLIRKPVAAGGNPFIEKHSAWVRSAVAELGLLIHENFVAGGRKAVDDDTLRRICRETCPVVGDASEIADERELLSPRMYLHLMKGHGILLAANGEVDFVHNVFREVVAGRCLGQRRVAELRKYALEEKWHGPIRYWAGLKAQQELTRHEISALVGELAADVAEGNDLAVLAQAEILAEVRTEAPENTLSVDLQNRLASVREQLVQLLRREDLDFVRRMKVGDLLAAVGDRRTALPDFDRVVKIDGGAVRIGRQANHKTLLEKYARVPASPPIDGKLRSYKIARYEVTNAEYAAFIQAGGYDIEAYWPQGAARLWAQRDDNTVAELTEKARQAALIHMASELLAGRLDEVDIHNWCDRMVRRRLPLHWGNPAFNRSNQPVVGVNWWECLAYCRWRTEEGRKQGKLGPQEAVRLPTEAEWEWAARRCGDDHIYPWVDGEPSQNALVREVCTRHQVARSFAVGSFEFASSRLEVFDLAGNVWEWTTSLAKPYSPEVFEQVVEEESLEDRIARGSSWMSSEREATEVTFRSFDPPYNAYDDLGFRVVVIELGQA